MTDLKHTFKKKLSNQIGSQVPEFVIAQHPKFVEFIESYFLFMESAELNLESITSIDNILLETETTTSSFLLLDRTTTHGLDAGDRVVDEQLSFGGSFFLEYPQEPYNRKTLP